MGHEHIEAETNEYHYEDDIFKCIFSNENAWISTKITEVCRWGYIQQYSSIGSANGSAPNRRQAIVWTKGGLVNWRTYASLGRNDLMPKYTVWSP